MFPNIMLFWTATVGRNMTENRYGSGVLWKEESMGSRISKSSKERKMSQERQFHLQILRGSENIGGINS